MRYIAPTGQIPGACIPVHSRAKVLRWQRVSCGRCYVHSRGLPYRNSGPIDHSSRQGRVSTSGSETAPRCTAAKLPENADSVLVSGCISTQVQTCPGLRSVATTRKRRLGIPIELTRVHGYAVNAEQVAAVNDFVDGCTVAFHVLPDKSAAVKFEKALHGEWRPPLSKR